MSHEWHTISCLLTYRYVRIIATYYIYYLSVHKQIKEATRKIPADKAFYLKRNSSSSSIKCGNHEIDL